jgi:hypothetical protein
MVRICFLILMINMWSCQKKSSVENLGTQAEVDPAPLEITNSKVIDWRVGIDRQQTISRGFTISVDLPMMTKKNIDVLNQLTPIDAWYLQLRKGGEVLQKISIPIATGKRQTSSIMFNIQYAASAISMRFANSPCPQLNHRRIIDRPRLSNAVRNSHKLIVSKAFETPVSGLTAYGITGDTINGGHSLSGQYLLEIALMDRASSLLKSNLVTYPEQVNIGPERVGEVKGCEGFQLPDSDNERGIENFRFGR